MVPVDEREIEQPARRQESRQGDLRSLRVELQHPSGACFIDHLEPDVRKPLELIGVERDVPRTRVTVCQQSVTDEERGDAIAKAHFDRRRRILSPHPRSQNFALPGRNAYRREAMQLSIAPGNHGTALEKTSHHVLDASPIHAAPPRRMTRDGSRIVRGKDPEKKTVRSSGTGLH